MALAWASELWASSPLWPRPQRGGALAIRGRDSLASSLAPFDLSPALAGWASGVLPLVARQRVGRDREFNSRVLHLAFEDASRRAREFLDSSISSGARLLLLDSSSMLLLSWGSQRPSLHRHSFQVSTPGPVPSRKRDVQCPSTKACHRLDTFRPCRSSRLRRFSPPGRCRLVASCSRSWDSPRFRWMGSHRAGCSVPSGLGRFQLDAFPRHRGPRRRVPSSAPSELVASDRVVDSPVVTGPPDASDLGHLLPSCLGPRTVTRRVWEPDASPPKRR
jgi:hypothetical protein